MAGNRDFETAELLKEAAATVTTADANVEPWDYGWCVPEYRNSSAAAFTGPLGPVTLSADGKLAYVAAVENLLTRSDIRSRWNSDELWSVVGHLLIQVASERLTDDVVVDRIRTLRTLPPALNVFPIANVTWSGPPLALADVLIGSGGAELEHGIAQKLRRRDEDDLNVLRAYLADDTGERQDVFFACLTPGQGGLAFAQAERRLESVLDLALMLEPNREGKKLFSLRGAANRPGVRGIAIDRGAVERHLGRAAGQELVARPLFISESGRTRTARWNNADPVPLESLLQPAAAASIAQVLSDFGPVSRRLLVSARWFAEAYWANASDDAALALGVALDALLGSKSGLPGRAMAERYALLEPAPEKRESRARRYHDIFGVRSSVAHGGQSSRLDDYRYIRAVENDVTWAAVRLLALAEAFQPSNDTEFDGVFEGLRWGTHSWPDATVRIAAGTAHSETSALRPHGTHPPGSDL